MRGRRLAGVALLVSAVALAACGNGSAEPGPTIPGSTTTTPTTLPGSTTTTPATVPGSTTTTPVPGIAPYVPLFPFGSALDVAAWQEAYRSSGAEPWHLDAGGTAVAFAAWLGFGGIDTVTGVRTDAAGAHVSVGFHTEESTTGTSTAAVVHLVRWGAGVDAPWEVVGTDDTTFSLLQPTYGSVVTSPMGVGGRITGVDESITVQVRTATSVVGTRCCLPAGGTDSPWSTTVTMVAPPGAVLTVVAHTGGHVTTVERFTVTGVRAG